MAYLHVNEEGIRYAWDMGPCSIISLRSFMHCSSILRMSSFPSEYQESIDTII